MGRITDGEKEVQNIVTVLKQLTKGKLTEEEYREQAKKMATKLHSNPSLDAARERLEKKYSEH